MGTPSAAFDRSTLEALASAGAPRRFRAGQALFHEGDPSDHVALLRAGRVKISAQRDNGTEVVLGVRGPGELVGELSAIDGRARSASAFAVEPVEAAVIPGEDFLRLLGERPQATLALLHQVIDRLRDADRQRVEFGSENTMPRVARRLLELAAAYGRAQPDGTTLIELPFTQEELAGWVGASRESVARALASLRSTGVVTTARRAITVVDLSRLRSLSR